MKTDYRQFVARKGTAALMLCTVAFDWLGLRIPAVQLPVQLDIAVD